MKSYSEKLIELDTFIESSKKTVDVFKQKLLSGYGTPEDAKLLREWENHLWSQQLTRTELVQETKKMTKKVFKSRDGSSLWLVEVGILNANNEIIFHKPLRDRMTHISLYDICFYTKGESGECQWLSEVKETKKEITTTVDGLNCSLGYIDHTDNIVFYDQYL